MRTPPAGRAGGSDRGTGRRRRSAARRRAPPPRPPAPPRGCQPQRRRKDSPAPRRARATTSASPAPGSRARQTPTPPEGRHHHAHRAPAPLGGNAVADDGHHQRARDATGGAGPARAANGFRIPAPGRRRWWTPRTGHRRPSARAGGWKRSMKSSRRQSGGERRQRIHRHQPAKAAGVHRPQAHELRRQRRRIMKSSRWLNCSPAMSHSRARSRSGGSAGGDSVMAGANANEKGWTRPPLLEYLVPVV